MTGGMRDDDAPAPRPTGRLLGVDYGERRIGLAISDPLGHIASPVGFLQRRARKRPPIAALVERATTLEARGIVIGLPLDEQGDETPRCAEVRVVGAEIERRTGLPVRFVDERFTTARARRAITAMEGSTRGRRGDVDALAATVLLQHALDLPG
jgi:putative Holliday junction resolvase